MEILQNIKYDFMGKRKVALVVSTLLIIISLASLFTRGLNFGLDFTGGTVVVVNFEKIVEVSEGRVTEIERLSFVGNRAFSDRRLRRVLETKQAGALRFLIGKDTFVEDRIGLDRVLLRDFYQARGYVDFGLSKPERTR